LHQVRSAHHRAKKQLWSTPSSIRTDAETELQNLELSQKRLESQVAQDEESVLTQKVRQRIKTDDTSSTGNAEGHKYVNKGELRKEFLVAKFENLQDKKGARAVERIIGSRKRKLSQTSRVLPKAARAAE